MTQKERNAHIVRNAVATSNTVTIRFGDGTELCFYHSQSSAARLFREELGRIVEQYLLAWQTYNQNLYEHTYMENLLVGERVRGRPYDTPHKTVQSHWSGAIHKENKAGHRVVWGRSRGYKVELMSGEPLPLHLSYMINEKWTIGNIAVQVADTGSQGVRGEPLP